MCGRKVNTALLTRLWPHSITQSDMRYWLSDVLNEPVFLYGSQVLVSKMLTKSISKKAGLAFDADSLQ